MKINMLKSITIQNYRSHEKTTFLLHSNVNVIVGRGQAGKTNVMRAFNTLRTNRPMGFKYQSWFTDKDTIITTETTEGTVVEFTKNKKGAGYSLRIQGTVPSTGDYSHNKYETVGTKVPEPVTQALNIDDLNMQWQHDTPYLITGSSGDIGRAINKVIDFSELDTWIKTIKGETRRLNTQKEVKEKAITDQQLQLAALPDTKAAGTLITNAELFNSKVTSYQNKIVDIETTVKNVKNSVDSINRYAPMLDAEKFIYKAEEYQNTANSIQVQINWINKGIDYYNTLKRKEEVVAAIKAKLWEAVSKLAECPMCRQPISDKSHLNHILEAL